MRRFSLILLTAILALSIAAASCSKMDKLTGPETTISQTTTDTTATFQKPGAAPHRLASDPRQAIILECYYALSEAHNGTSGKSIWGYAVSDWRYIFSDPHAYSVLKSYYGSNASVVGGGYPNGPFYTNLFAYAFEDYSGVGNVGRGGQCPYFVNMILYRSETYGTVGNDGSRMLSSYNTYIDDYNSSRSKTKSIDAVQPGDVIQTTWSGGHRAIAIRVLSRDAAGHVTSLEVIDSNFVGNAGHEIIGRHPISRIASGVKGNGSTSDLDSYFALKLAYH